MDEIILYGVIVVWVGLNIDLWLTGRMAKKFLKEAREFRDVVLADMEQNRKDRDEIAEKLVEVEHLKKMVTR